MPVRESMVLHDPRTDQPIEVGPALPDDLTDRCRRAADLERACEDAERRVLTARTILKGAQKEYEVTVAALREYCRELGMSAPAALPLFDETGEVAASDDSREDGDAEGEAEAYVAEGEAARHPREKW